MILPSFWSNFSPRLSGFKSQVKIFTLTPPPPPLQNSGLLCKNTSVKCNIGFNHYIWLSLFRINIDNQKIEPETSGWVNTGLVLRSQTFRLTAEGLECMVGFIGQGPPMRPFGRHVKQPIIVCFVQRHVSWRGNVATITDRCVKLSDVF